jgi:hypothetical protein
MFHRHLVCNLLLPFTAQSTSGRSPLLNSATQTPPILLPPTLRAASYTSRLLPVRPASQPPVSAQSSSDELPLPVSLPLPTTTFLPWSSTQSLSYVDVYMDDFLGLAQGHSPGNNLSLYRFCPPTVAPIGQETS